MFSVSPLAPPTGCKFQPKEKDHPAIPTTIVHFRQLFLFNHIVAIQGLLYLSSPLSSSPINVSSPLWGLHNYAPESLLKVLVFRQLELPILSQTCDTNSNTNPDAQKNTTTNGAPHPNLSQTCDTDSNTNPDTQTNTNTSFPRPVMPGEEVSIFSHWRLITD